MVTGVLTQGQSGQGVHLTTHFQLVPRFGMSGSIPLHPPSWLGQTKFYHYLFFFSPCRHVSAYYLELEERFVVETRYFSSQVWSKMLYLNLFLC